MKNNWKLTEVHTHDSVLDIDDNYTAKHFAESMKSMFGVATLTDGEVKVNAITSTNWGTGIITLHITNNVDDEHTEIPLKYNRVSAGMGREIYNAMLEVACVIRKELEDKKHHERIETHIDGSLLKSAVKDAIMENSDAFYSVGGGYSMSIINPSSYEDAMIMIVKGDDAYEYYVRDEKRIGKEEWIFNKDWAVIEICGHIADDNWKDYKDMKVNA